MSAPASTWRTVRRSNQLGVSRIWVCDRDTALELEFPNPTPDDVAKAEFMVTALNAHAALVAALRDLMGKYATVATMFNDDEETTDGTAASFDGSNLKALERARAALAKVQS